MNAALFVQDKELKGNDYLFYNGSSLSQDNPLREKVFSKPSCEFMELTSKKPVL